jgi:endoglucanase
MTKQRAAALPVATLAAATVLAAVLPTGASAAAAGFTVKPATAAACTVNIQVITPPAVSNIVVDLLTVTNTGSALAGWTLTISTDTQIQLAGASQGTWSNPWFGEIVGSSSGTLSTGSTVIAGIDGPGLGQPYVTLNGAVCTS